MVGSKTWIAARAVCSSAAATRWTIKAAVVITSREVREQVLGIEKSTGA